MIYKVGEIGISVEQIEGFGKKPGLWIVTGNEFVKVASFGSEQKALLFCERFERMTGIDRIEHICTMDKERATE